MQIRFALAKKSLLSKGLTYRKKPQNWFPGTEDCLLPRLLFWSREPEVEAYIRTALWGLTWAGDTAGVHSRNHHKSARTTALLASVRSLLELQKALRAVSGPRFLRPTLSSFQGFFFSEGEKGEIEKKKKRIRLLLNENFF